jgi:uncharacterized protein
MNDLIYLLSQKTSLQKNHISNILKLLDEGATIPFIARYRKEMTGEASDDTLRDFYEIYLSAKRLLERKEEILKLLTERELLTVQLKEAIEKSQTMTALEDVYRPYKEKKNSRASLAIKNGLEPLANILQSAKLNQKEFESNAKRFIKGDVKNVDDAIKGAKDIIAERFSDNPKERKIVREMTERHGVIEVKKGKEFDEQGVYKNYKEHTEKVAFIPSHRYLAIRRAEKEKELSVKITIESDRYLETLKRYKHRDYMASSKSMHYDCHLNTTDTADDLDREDLRARRIM